MSRCHTPVSPFNFQVERAAAEPEQQKQPEIRLGRRGQRDQESRGSAGGEDEGYQGEEGADEEKGRIRVSCSALKLSNTQMLKCSNAQMLKSPYQ